MLPAAHLHPPCHSLRVYPTLPILSFLASACVQVATTIRIASMSHPPQDADGVNPSAASRIDLTNKRALVTGGHRGIGAAIVLGLAAAGAHVAVIDRGGSASRTSDVPRRVRGYGVEFFAAAADLGDPEQLMAAVSRVLSEFGSIDILVNNAYVAA